MIVNQKQLFDLIDKILKPHNYIRKRETWYLHTPECICFFTISKSLDGGSYGEAFGCFLKEVKVLTHNLEFPDYTKSHLRISISFFVDKEIVEKAFDLENHEFKNNEREEAIKHMIEQYVLPFLEGISSKEGLKKSIVKYPGLKNYMKLTLKEALQIPIAD